ncbi:MAG: glycosyltransferase family 39 protein, partial [Planctomycetota bacterium]
MPWIAIFALAFALRALNVWLLADTPLARTPHGDGRVYLEWADAIRDGGFAGLWSGEVFYQAPLYPHLLAVFRSLFGESLFALRIAQALVGALTATLIGLATSRMVGRRAGIAAGVLIAIYAPSIWLDGLVQKSALVGFLCASTLTVSTVDSQRGRIALGVAVGLLTLTRGEARLFAIALAAWVFTTRGGRALVPYAAGLALTLAPVLARNVVAGGEWILTTSQSGPNLYIGNAPGSLGTYAPLVPGRGDARSEAEDARRLAEAAETRTLTAREVSSHWRGRAVETMRGDPNAALGRFARKGILALNAAELADTDDFTRAAESSFALRIGPGFGILLALAAAGAALATSDERRRLSVPALLAATQWLALVAFFVFARYRLPLALALAPFAGLSLASLPRVRGRALAAAAVALAIAHVPLEAARPERGRAAALVNEGVLLVDDDRPSEAEVLATQAVELVPGFFDAHRLQGLARLEQERPRDAIAPLERAHALSPDDWQVR